MFTIDQIEKAHAKVKSGADFPKYVEDLKELGVLIYSVEVIDGHSEYKGKDNYKIVTGGIYPQLNIASIADNEKFKHYLKIHQQGQTDYFTFCAHAAETGVEKWVVDVLAKTCSYYDKTANAMLVEKIP